MLIFLSFFCFDRHSSVSVWYDKSANYSSFGFQPQAKYEVIKKNGQIAEIIQYSWNGESGWQTFAKYEFEYYDTEISAARFASMINYYITNHGGNYYIFNWY